MLGTFNLMSHGMEDWHPNPDFFFKLGAGPVLDIGVYYITQLVNLLGPIKLINSVSSTAQEERTITSQPRYGEKIKVEKKIGSSYRCRILREIDLSRFLNRRSTLTAPNMSVVLFFVKVSKPM